MYCTNDGKVEDDISKTVRELIRNNDLEILHSTLTDISNFEREKLISAGTVGKDFTSDHYKHSTSALKKPCPLLFEAVTLGKVACVSILLENGFTFETRDNNGWNILHYLIAVSYFDPSYEATAVDIWRNVQKKLNPKQLEYLLKQEDLEELRPVELALHLGCLLIFNEIINSSIYLTERKQFALWERLTYDITDYENCGCRDNRRSKGLLLLAAHVDKTILTRKQHVGVLRHGMLQKWTHSKLIINILPICIWFLLRFFAFLAFYLIISSDLPLNLRIEQAETDLISYLHSLNFTNLTTWKAQNDSIVAVFEDNQTYTNKQRAELQKIVYKRYSLCQPHDWYHVFNVPQFYGVCLIFMISFSILSILYDILEQCLSLRRKWYRWRFAFGKRKTLIIASTYYRTCQFLFSFFVLIWFIYYLTEPDSWVAEYGIIMTCYLSVWSILYFLQMMPLIGHFVNSIQKMLTIMVQFLIVYFFVLIPYPHAFLVLLSSDTRCEIKGFNNIGEATYTTFKAMLNMVQFDQLARTGFGAVHILHIIYVFTVAILLVNFLIALLSTSVGETVEARDVIMMLQRLSVISALEKRCCLICPCFYKLMQRLVYKCEKGRIYLQFSVFTGIKTENRAE